MKVEKLDVIGMKNDVRIRDGIEWVVYKKPRVEIIELSNISHPSRHLKMTLQPSFRPFIIGSHASPHTLDIFR